MNYDQVCTMIGIIAHDIRGNWRDISSRLSAIVELCESIKEYKWVDQIYDNTEHIYDDGRWFRDHFDGPYVSEMCTPKLVGRELYDKYAFVLTYNDGGDSSQSYSSSDSNDNE